MVGWLFLTDALFTCKKQSVRKTVSFLVIVNSCKLYTLKIQLVVQIPQAMTGLFQKLDVHPLKKTWESQNFNPHFSLGIPKKLKHFFGHEGKEDKEIPQNDHF